MKDHCIFLFAARVLGGLGMAALAASSAQVLAASSVGAQPSGSVNEVVQSAKGISMRTASENLRITVCGDSVLHVVAGQHALESGEQPWMLSPEVSCPGAQFTFSENSGTAILSTAKVQLILNLAHRGISFRTRNGEMLLSENPSEPRTYEPALVNGEATQQISDRFLPDATEAFYGLGQHQGGLFNYRGNVVNLAQNNTEVAIPLLVSSKGYAVLWNSASLSSVDNRFPQHLKITSSAANTVDYYLIYGPEMDQIIHEYRSLTGHVPMLPKWAFGFIQSKNRYKTLDEIEGVGDRYRSEHIPVDAIVQDYYWWNHQGDPEFNPGYANVQVKLGELHKKHLHTMISVWPLFDPSADNFKAMTAKGLEVPGTHDYDATSSAGRDFFWNQLAGKLFAEGWDSFWLDASEPEEYWPHAGDAVLQSKQLAIGNGARYTNLFPLMHTSGVEEHWRDTTDRKRVFILTRSAFLGEQRTGSAVWSGDIYSTFWSLSHQVPAGLNLALSGFPYWTTDIGGYLLPGGYASMNQDEIDSPGYQHLYARWFEFGAFCPIFRSHGRRPNNEMWTYQSVEPILLQYDRLRYRLMPYIYSLAWRVTDSDYTMQRPLVMDFRGDQTTWGIGDEYMFGSAILVSPVLKENATQRTVYLPGEEMWYDFWSGAVAQGGREIEADAPLEKLPLFVRAGSIVPLGPEIEYADQSPEGPIELRVYSGADGEFNLYQDEGDNYGYEQKKYSVTPIRWSESTRTLTIGERQGSYPGMPKATKFNIVWVKQGRGTGESIVAEPDRSVVYDGHSIAITEP